MHIQSESAPPSHIETRPDDFELATLSFSNDPAFARDPEGVTREQVEEQRRDDIAHTAAHEPAPTGLFSMNWGQKLLLTLASLPFLASGAGAAEVQKAAAGAQEPPAKAARLPAGNMFLDVKEAIRAIDAGLLEPRVKEIENRFNGHFRYVFELREKEAALDPLIWPDARPRSTRELVVITPKERSQLLAVLEKNGFTVTGSQSEPIVVTPPPVTLKMPERRAVAREQETDYSGLIFNGLLIGILAAGVYIAYRSYRAQRNFGGGNPGGGGGNPPPGRGRGRDSEYDATTSTPGEALAERPKQTFRDVGGCPEVIADLTELKHDMITVMQGGSAIELPRGILLSGPPGTGKTLIARALAGECDVPFVHVDSSQSGTTIFVGTGAMKVMKTWETARYMRDMHTRYLRALPGATGNEEGVCIIFYDEFDSLGSRRVSNEHGFGGEEEHKKVVNTLLNQMDGLDSNKNRNILVLAATNFSTDLDPALLRPGRFSKKVSITQPHSVDARLDILEKLSRRLVHEKDCGFADRLALEYIAKITPGKTGDDLRDVLTQSVDIARRQGRILITNEDLFEAYQRQSFGRAKKGALTPEKHELVIRHENGHALCALACGIDLFLASAMPRGQTGGRVVIDPEGLPEILATKRDMLKSVLLSAGGRAAELEAYGPSGITAGAGMDLHQIRQLVTDMISQGLFEGLYSQTPHGSRPDLWKDNHRALIDDIASRAIDNAREIISSLGKETVDGLVHDFQALDRELIGPEAQYFYESRIGAQHLARMKEIAEKFFQNPTGRSDERPA